MTDRLFPRDRLAPFLDAGSIALIGASSDPNKLSGRTVRFLRQQRFAGEIYPINRSREQIDGVRCYPSVRDVGRPIDVALVLTPAGDSLAALREGADAGLRSFILSASGFAEAGADGARMQDEIARFARDAGISVMGPNCVGVINSRTRLMATFSGVGEALEIIPGGFSFASQSGALAAYWLDLVTTQRLGFSKWISTGNEVDLTISDAVFHLAYDPDTRVIGLYLEGVRDGPRLRQALALARRAGKVVLAVKTGATAAGAAATLSHTGAVSGSDDVWNAVFRQCGVVRCRSLTEMIGYAKLPLLQGGVCAVRRPAIISVSGGAGAMLTDEAARGGLEIVDFSAESKAALAAALPPFAATQNPIDVTGAASPNPRIFTGSLDAILDDAEHDSVIVFLGLSRRGVADNFVDALLARPDRRGKPLVVVSLGTLPHLRAQLESAGIPVFDDVPEAIRALSLGIAMGPVPDLQTGPPVAARAAGGATRTLAEHACPAFLGAAWPFAWPRQALVARESEVDPAVAGLRFPLVAKLQSEAMPHKTEHGGVILRLADPAQARRAVAALLARARQLGIACDGILLQEMASFDHELLVGLRHDANFGPVIVIGRGGVDVEAEADVETVVAPAGAAELAAAIRRLRYRPILERGRGRTPVDVDRLAQGLARLLDWYCGRPDVVEVEINPLAIGPACGIVPLDAMVAVVEDPASRSR